MFCTQCGNELRDTDVFCSKCGTKVATVLQEKKSTNGSGLRLVSNKCEACGASSLKEIGPGKFLCEYCGSEYVTNEAKEVIECKLTEKEIMDIFLEAEQYATRNESYKELQCFLGVAEKASDNTLFLVKLGRAYRRNNMLDKAMECYEKAIKLNPLFANAYSNIGAVHIFFKQYAQAEEYCKKGLALMEQNRGEYTNDDYAICLSNYALAVGYLGRKEEAKVYLKRAEAAGYQNGDKVRSLLGIKKGLFW